MSLLARQALRFLISFPIGILAGVAAFQFFSFVLTGLASQTPIHLAILHLTTKFWAYGAFVLVSALISGERMARISLWISAVVCLGSAGAFVYEAWSMPTWIAYFDAIGVVVGLFAGVVLTMREVYGIEIE